MFCLAGQTAAMGVKGDAAAGKQKAAACAACHGADGNKTLDNTYPKLAGQYPDYLLKALKDYKSGKRVNAVMAGQVQALTDADMANLAVYFGSLKGQMGIVK
nr:c-type cytochrome [Arenimonas sp. GDDSR-1]